MGRVVYLFVLVLLVLLLQVWVTGAAQVGLGQLVAGKHFQARQRARDHRTQLTQEAVLQQLLGTARDLCAAVSCTRESTAFTRKPVYATSAMNALCRH